MLTISGNQFLLNNQPFRLLSGAVHYFRVVPEYSLLKKSDSQKY